MASWVRNQTAHLFNAVSARIAVTRDALTKILQSIRETASLSYYRRCNILCMDERDCKTSQKKKLGKKRNKLETRRKDRRKHRFNSNRE